MFVAFTVALVLAQAPAATEPAIESPAERAAAAAEKAAAAAQMAAEAAQRIADVVAPIPAPVAAVPPEKKPDGWIGSFGAGLTFITGNSQTLTLTGNLAADRKWDAWSLALRLSGAYGLSNPDAAATSSTTSTTARRAAGSVRGDRSFGGFASLFVLGGSEFDHVKNIESRSVGELGTGLTFFNQKQGDFEKLFLRVDLALRAGYETRFQYFPTPGRIAGDYGIIILAPRAAFLFRWAFSQYVRVTEELEFIPFLLQPTAGRLLINNLTKLSARITETVSLTTSVAVNFDSAPPGNTPEKIVRVPTDVALTAGLEAAF